MAFAVVPLVGSQYLFDARGEQQMTAVGRPSMTRPTRLLLDEPSLGLAPLIVRAIFEALVVLDKDDELGVVLAEQNLVVARRYTHTLPALSGRRSEALAEDGSTDLANIVIGRLSAVDPCTYDGPVPGGREGGLPGAARREQPADVAQATASRIFKRAPSRGRWRIKGETAW